MKVTYPFTVSKNGSYKRYHEHMLRVKAHIERNWLKIVETFDIKRDVEIRLRPLPRRRTLGNHKTVGGKVDEGNHFIELDISKKLSSLMHTLFHELTHAEQVEQKRLQHNFNTHTLRMEWIWEGRNYGRNCGFGQTAHQLDRYKSQPWEKDANDRADKEMARYEALIGPLQ